MLSHSSSVISNTKLYKSWDIIPSSSLDVKAIHVLSLVKGDTELLIPHLKKIGIPLMNT